LRTRGAVSKIGRSPLSPDAPGCSLDNPLVVEQGLMRSRKVARKRPMVNEKVSISVVLYLLILLFIDEVKS
jgi:hypothetical protein